MASGICIYAENFQGALEPATAELLQAARQIQAKTGERIQAIIVAQDCGALVEELKRLHVDDIYQYETGRGCLMQDDALSHVIAEMIRQADPSSVLIPATTEGRSIFSRVAAKLGCGLTADCTELKVGQREDGAFYIRQNKPSFGENVFVTIITREGYYPQMMTVRPGVYQPQEMGAAADSAIHDMSSIPMPRSKVEVVEMQPSEAETGSILAAEVVVVGGRGALEDGNFELLQKFAEKVGGAIGGTRPLADSGLIPFEHQIGQTGFTIRPKICISFGVSGAIQHTEGIKDTKLYVAVNTDENAPVFNNADYGMTVDMKDILTAYLAN